MPSVPDARRIRARAAAMLRVAAALHRRGSDAAASYFYTAAERTRRSSLVDPTGDEITALAWRAHADGQMASARLTDWSVVRSDCVASARNSRRVARGFLRDA